MKRVFIIFLGFVLVSSLLLTGCGKKADADPLAALDRNAPYTATLPSVTTQIDPSQSEDEDTVLIGTVAGVTSSVNVRNEASTSGTVLGSVQAGDKFLVTEKDAYEGWHRIDYNGQTGFIFAEYLTVTEGTADMLAVASTDAGGAEDTQID